MTRDLYVVFRTDGHALAAIPARHVRETMRPLPLEPIAGAPAFVSGAAIVRGRPVPVVDAAKLVSGQTIEARRWLALEVGARTAILAVHEVIGVQPLNVVNEPAPLLAGAARGAIDELATRDGELLAVLRAAKLLDLSEERIEGKAHAR